jgi:hypothetical protein
MQLTLIWTSTVTFFLSHRSVPWFWNVQRAAAPVTWSARILPPHFFPFWSLASLKQMDCLLFSYTYLSIWFHLWKFTCTATPPGIFVSLKPTCWTDAVLQETMQHMSLTQSLVKVLLSVIYLCLLLRWTNSHICHWKYRAGRQKYWGPKASDPLVLLPNPLSSFVCGLRCPVPFSDFRWPVYHSPSLPDWMFAEGQGLVSYLISPALEHISYPDAYSVNIERR